MRYRVTLTPEARADLLRLNDFLARQSPEAARRAMDTLESRLRSLGDRPDRAPEGAPDTRELMIPFGGFVYVVQFRVDPEVVVIARIFHMREHRKDRDD